VSVNTSPFPSPLLLKGARIEPTTRTVSRNDGAQIPLSYIEFRILEYLWTQRGVVVTRQQLLQEVWGYHSQVASRTVDTTLYRLRIKIEVNPAQPDHLQSVRGHGIPSGVRHP